MPDLRRVLGDRGETLAAEHLRSIGCKILARQYRCPQGEIDIVAIDGDEVIFAEVKTRQDQSYGFPEEAVTAAKIRHLVLAAEHFLRSKHLEGRPWRIDVLAVLLQPEPTVKHWRNIDVPEIFW